MSAILFNKGKQYTKGGETMDVVSLQDVIVEETEKKELPWLQLFDTGYRVTTDTLDWSRWNGCVYSDIDSKHYYKECRAFDAEKLRDALHDYLLINFNYNFYALQVSNSGTGYHILFYFDVEKNEVNFKKCAQIVQGIVKEAFVNIGAGEIYDWPKVNDHCSTSPLQGMFLTNNPFLWGNYSQQAFGDFEDFDTYELRDEGVRVSDVQKDGTKLFEFKSYKPPKKPVGYKDHHQRWAIYDALIAVFESKEVIDGEWGKVCGLLPEDNGHKRGFYLKEPEKNRWYERHSSVTWVNIDVLKEFGYKFYRRFVPMENATSYEPDEVYMLQEGQRLSDISINWDRDRINHLFAGCSLGKTYNAKHLGAYRYIDDVDWVFGERQTKICFISPMRSINKDSFGGVENWIIIDSDHKAELLHQYESLQNAVEKEGVNICTTWESYCSNEMWKYRFDYVIVDEVHMFYMPDYRLQSVRDMKAALKNSKGIRIIMTGTPSYELKEFDCKKIQVKKEQPKVSAEIVLYNDSFKGHYMADIIEWTKDENHYAILFDDHVNYKTEESFKKYGLNCSVFNSKYEENVSKVLMNQTVISQISAFSIYGQAGINLYIEPDKKVRVYIINNGGMGIIQYANRIRNKEVIDKVMIGYPKKDVKNGIRKIREKVDLPRGQQLVEQLNKTIHYDKNPFSMKNLSVIKLKWGLDPQYLDRTEGGWSINPSLYETHFRIKEVDRYERQLQVINDRLEQNDFTVTYTYLDKDTDDPIRMGLRSDTFAGQMTRLQFSECMKYSKKNKRWWFAPDDALKKVCTGNLEETIENIYDLLNSRYSDPQKEFDIFVQRCIGYNETVRKRDIETFEQLLMLRKDWEKYYDNSFVAAMMDSRWNVKSITAAYVRSVYKDGVKWKKVADESYSIISRLCTAIKQYPWLLDGVEGVNKMNVEYDDLTNEIYSYVVSRHSRGRKKKEGEVSRSTKWRRAVEQRDVSK